MILDNLSRDGEQANVKWLQGTHGSRLRVEVGDVTDAKRVGSLVRNASQVFHLAAQVAVTTSLEDPAHDLQTNLIGTFNVLEAARAVHTPPPVLFTSTNKVYGGLEEVGVTRAGEAYRYADGRGGISETAATAGMPTTRPQSVVTSAVAMPPARSPG